MVSSSLYLYIWKSYVKFIFSIIYIIIIIIIKFYAKINKKIQENSKLYILI